MPSSTGDTTLYVFAISHYCEKARWTLDYLGIEYTLKFLPPGIHAQIANKLGAAGTSLPLLVSDGTVIQGSDFIFDWAVSRSLHTSTGGNARPEASLDVDDEIAALGQAIEERLDSVAGVQTRRYFYSEALVEYPDTVLPTFSRNLQSEERETLEKIWMHVRTAMMTSMDLGREQWDDARGILEAELDWLDGLLEGGAKFLMGDRFSRVDITGASLLALLAEVPEHPTYRGMPIPPRISADIARWRDRPSLHWVQNIYRDFRNART